MRLRDRRSQLGDFRGKKSRGRIGYITLFGRGRGAGVVGANGAGTAGRGDAGVAQAAGIVEQCDRGIEQRFEVYAARSIYDGA